MEIVKNVIAVLSPALGVLAASLPGGVTGDEWAAIAGATLGALVAWSRGNHNLPDGMKW